MHFTIDGSNPDSFHTVPQEMPEYKFLFFPKQTSFFQLHTQATNV